MPSRLATLEDQSGVSSADFCGGLVRQLPGASRRQMPHHWPHAGSNQYRFCGRERSGMERVVEGLCDALTIDQGTTGMSGLVESVSTWHSITATTRQTPAPVSRHAASTHRTTGLTQSGRSRSGHSSVRIVRSRKSDLLEPPDRLEAAECRTQQHKRGTAVRDRAGGLPVKTVRPERP